jgi:hypothetical protein
MGLTQRRTNYTLGSIGSTQILSIDAERRYTISSGFVAIEVTNLGDSDIYYGNSGVTQGSGGFMAPHASKFWDGICDNFELYFISVNSSYVCIHEYEGR